MKLLNPKTHQQATGEGGGVTAAAADNDNAEFAAQVQRAAFDEGRRRALDSGATDAHPDDLTPLEEHARALARENSRPRFDPRLNPDDALRAARHDDALNELKVVDRKREFAEARLWEMDARRAGHADPGPCPALRPIAALCLATLVAVSVAPTAHDLFGANDEVLGWLMAGIVGFATGGTLLVSIFFGHGEAGGRTWLGYGGTIGAILVGVALGVVRAAAAEDGNELLLAAGLTTLEIAVVLLAERMARRLERERTAWRERSAKAEVAAQERQSAQAELDALTTKATTLQRHAADHLSHLADRRRRSYDVAAVEEAAAVAARDGFAAGVAQNQGRLLGVGRFAS